MPVNRRRFYKLEEVMVICPTRPKRHSNLRKAAAIIAILLSIVLDSLVFARLGFMGVRFPSPLPCLDRRFLSGCS